MTKKHFIALANAIKSYNRNQNRRVFTRDQMEALACFCAAQNRAFDRDRWLGYIAGTCGPNGGNVERRARRLSADWYQTTRRVTHVSPAYINALEQFGADRPAVMPVPALPEDIAQMVERAFAATLPGEAERGTSVATPAAPTPSLEDSINFLRSR